jgi:hypothetical protein
MRSTPGGTATAAAASLIPWAGFIAAAALTDVVRGDPTATSISDVARAAPSLLAFIALPSALALLVARTRALRLLALLAMTAASATAGVAVTASDDAQAGLALLWVPLLALPLAAVLWVGQTVAASQGRDRATTTVAGFSDRLAALAIDALIVAAALVVPLTAMGHGKEVAAVVVGVAAATAYFAGLVLPRGQTVGESLLRLTVVDAQTLQRPRSVRRLLRSLIIVLEVAGAWTVILSPPAVAEAASALLTGRSLTDRLLRTSVVTTGRNSV